MAFTDFKSISEVQRTFQITFSESHFLHIKPLNPSQTFLDELAFSQNHIDIFTSEASRCENIIYPIVREVYKQYADRCALWSHQFLSYDELLSGTPDYLISTKSALGKTVLAQPLLVIIEAKRNDFIQGWGQCLAALLAAQKLNADEDFPVYGIVTDGELWQFGRLLRRDFTKETIRLTINDLPAIFGAMAALLNAAEEALQTLLKA